MLHTKYQSSRPSSFWEEDFQRFCNFLHFGCHGNQTNGWNSISWTTLVELYPRNIPAKFHQDWPSGFRRRRCLKKLWTTDDARRTTDDGHWAITKAHHEHFVLRWAKQEGHDGLVSLHWLIREIHSYQTLHYLGIGLKHKTPYKD